MRRRRSAEQVRDRAVDPGLPGGWAPGVLEIADEFPAVRRRELCEVVGQTLLRRQRGAEIIGYVDTGWRGRAYLDTHPVAHHHARSGPRTAGQEEPVSTGSDRDESCLERRTPDLSDTGIRPARAQAASSALTRAGTSTKGSGPCRPIVARNRAGALASTCGPYDANGVPGLPCLERVRRWGRLGRARLLEVGPLLGRGTSNNSRAGCSGGRVSGVRYPDRMRVALVLIGPR